MIKPETPYVSFGALADVDSRSFVYPGFRDGVYKVVYVDGSVKGTIIKKSLNDYWVCDPKLIENYPKIGDVPLSKKTETTLRIVSGFIKSSASPNQKEEDMSTSKPINKDALTKIAKALSDKMIEEAISGNLQEAKEIRKELLSMTLELIELSDNIHKIYKTSVAYAIAVGASDKSRLLEDD